MTGTPVVSSHLTLNCIYSCQWLPLSGWFVLPQGGSLWGQEAEKGDILCHRSPGEEVDGDLCEAYQMVALGHGKGYWYGLEQYGNDSSQRILCTMVYHMELSLQLCLWSKTNEEKNNVLLMCHKSKYKLNIVIYNSCNCCYIYSICTRYEFTAYMGLLFSLLLLST